MRQTAQEFINSKQLEAPKNLQQWEAKKKKVDLEYKESCKVTRPRISDEQNNNLEELSIFQVDKILLLISNLRKMYKIDYIATLFECNPDSLRKTLSNISKGKYQKKKSLNKII